MRYSLTIAYDGTKYSGWQVQNNALAIQPLVQKALSTALRHPANLTGSGRTDAGVHARGQIAHFDTDILFHPKSLLISINAMLPPDIRILSVEARAADFHARYSAKAKIYHYHLHLDAVADPIMAPYRFHVLERLCRSKLISGTRYFLGRAILPRLPTKPIEAARRAILCAHCFDSMRVKKRGVSDLSWKPMAFSIRW